MKIPLLFRLLSFPFNSCWFYCLFFSCLLGGGKKERKKSKTKNVVSVAESSVASHEWRSPSTVQYPAISNCMIRGGEQKPPLLHFSQNCSQRNSNILPSLWDLEKVSKPIIINNCCHIARRQSFVGNCQMMFYVFDVPLFLFKSDQYLHPPGFSCFSCCWTTLATFPYAILQTASGTRNEKSFVAFHSFTYPTAAWVDYPRKTVNAAKCFYILQQTPGFDCCFCKVAYVILYFLGEQGCFNHGHELSSNKTAHGTVKS